MAPHPAPPENAGAGSSRQSFDRRDQERESHAMQPAAAVQPTPAVQPAPKVTAPAANSNTPPPAPKAAAPGAAPKNPQNNPDQPDFEQAMTELEALVERMERGELPLEEALKHFERGVELTGACQAALKAAEQKVEILLKKSGASEVTKFDPQTGETPDHTADHTAVGDDPTP